MQEGKLKLKEIIWEMTGRCENHCEYCGSKDAWNQNIDERLIINVAKNIALYPPEEIDMSGGDPLLINIDVHKKVTNILRGQRVKCKILTNPKSLVSGNVIRYENIEKLKLYDWIGFSINDKEDIENISHSAFEKILFKSTVITNFNIQNIFLYDDIEDFVKSNNLMWQIQYTMYKNKNEKLAIYNNEKALQMLSEKASKSWRDGRPKILVADNANAGTCGAGICSLGILSDGSVVPCLSMRSWVADINSVVVGNIIREEWKKDDENYAEFSENPLKFIWENRFENQRFGSFMCCKDHCGNSPLEMLECDTIEKQPKIDKDFPFDIDSYRIGKKSPPLFVYGVPRREHEGGTTVYACPGDFGPITSVYAVKINDSSSDINSIVTETSHSQIVDNQKDKDNE